MNASRKGDILMKLLGIIGIIIGIMIGIPSFSKAAENEHLHNPPEIQVVGATILSPYLDLS